MMAVLLAYVAQSAGAADGALVGWWQFDEGRDNHVRDASPNRNDGLATDIKWVEMGASYAAEFLAPEGRVTCGEGAALDIRGPVTLEAWVFPSGPAPSETGICGKSFQSYGLTFYTDGNLYWYISSGGNKCSAPLPVRRWSHVAGTFDGRRMALFINGKEVDECDSEFPEVKPAGDFLIGCIAKGAARTDSFRGAIGSVRLYDRACTAEELGTRYKDERGGYPGPPARYDTLMLRPYPYFDEGKLFIDADLCAYCPLRKGETPVLEFAREDGPAQRHELPELPDSGVYKDVAIDVGAVDPGVYNLRLLIEGPDGVRARCEVPVEYGVRPALPDPATDAAPPLAPPAAPPEFTCEIAPGGGLLLKAGGTEIPVETTFSYPHGGYNTLTREHGDGCEASWQPEVTTERRGLRVRAKGASYAVSRSIEQREGRLIVKDTFTNITLEPVGIMVSNHIDTSALDGLQATLHPNPSVFLSREGLGIGMVAMDDVYLEQHQTFQENGRCGIRTNSFGLESAGTYTLEWTVYLNATGDYFDFINAARADLGYAPTVEGGFAFTDRRESPSAEYVANRALKYASIGCLGEAADDPTLSLEGVEFIEYPKECALLKETFAETLRRYPDMKVMFHIAHSLYTTNRPEELFPDSRVINAAGEQTDYGGQNKRYYAKYFSQERVDEGYRWYIFYPTPSNSFGKYMLNAIDYMLHEIRANSMFADGFTMGYGGRFTYDTWDGRTVEIDPETKLIKRKYASVNLLAQCVLVDVVRRVRDQGGVVIANSYPGTRTVHQSPGLLYCLETAGGGKVCTRLYLTPSVIALGNPASLNTDRDVYEDLLEKLEWGALYFYYGEKTVAPDTIVSRMYPITVREIGQGLIKGDERIITTRSGVYGWPGDKRLHLTHCFDGRGILTGRPAPTTVDADGVRTKLDLLEDEAVVIEPIPIQVVCDAPVTVAVDLFSKEELALRLRGKAEARIVFSVGAMRSAMNYAVRVEEKEFTVQSTVGGGTVNVPVTLDGESEVFIKPK